MTTQHIKPTISTSSPDDPGIELSIWPAIPDVTSNPAIQIDWRTHGGNRKSAAMEFRKEDAPAIAAAILKAAEESA